MTRLVQLPTGMELNAALQLCLKEHGYGHKPPADWRLWAMQYVPEPGDSRPREAAYIKLLMDIPETPQPMPRYLPASVDGLRQLCQQKTQTCEVEGADGVRYVCAMVAP